MLFRIHVYLFEHKLAVEADEKKMSTEILFLRRKDKKHQKKNLIVNLLALIQVKVMKGYGIGRTQTFISKFKNRQLKNLKEI